MTNSHTALILAAGRGSRLLSMTDDRPKGLVKLNGKSLIQWQIAALKQAGIENVSVVTGYLGEQFESLGLNCIPNPEWDKTNMVGSLLCALEQIKGPLIISYSDIVYQSSLVKSISSCQEDFTLAYDTKWLELWSQRFEDPLSDAESFKISDKGYVTEIGKKVNDVNEIEGQFMGLMKISDEARHWIFDLIKQEPEKRYTLDTTTLINTLIKQGKAIKGIQTNGMWCEVDDQDDLKVAENLIKNGQLELE